MTSLPDTRDLVTLCDHYCQATGRSESRVADVIAMNPYLFQRLRANKGCTVRTYSQAIQWFSDHWPADAEWPAQILRPQPTPVEPVEPEAVEEAPAGAGGQVEEPVA